jgi:hypothetical protein
LDEFLCYQSAVVSDNSTHIVFYSLYKSTLRVVPLNQVVVVVVVVVVVPCATRRSS